jgi:Lon protease-like protein
LDLLPLFPLPSVVLFPNVFLPLHIFEPRYRAMVGDALRGDRLIGMVLLRSGWEKDYEGRPAIYPVGCIGVITHAARLDDGRYNMVLRGVERFRVIEENHDRAYRRAVYEAASERSLTADEHTAMTGLRKRLEALMTTAVETLGRRHLQHAADSRGDAPHSTAGLNDEELVNALAQYLDFDPLEKLALLEQNCLKSRAAALLELLEMKMMLARTPGAPRVQH